MNWLSKSGVGELEICASTNYYMDKIPDFINWKLVKGAHETQLRFKHQFNGLCAIKNSGI